MHNQYWLVCLCLLAFSVLSSSSSSSSSFTIHFLLIFPFRTTRTPFFASFFIPFLGQNHLPFRGTKMILRRNFIRPTTMSRTKLTSFITFPAMIHIRNASFCVVVGLHHHFLKLSPNLIIRY